jgi:putative lipoprotein
MATSETTVSGEIKFPSETPSFANATVYITLEGTGRMDAPAYIVNQQVLRGVSYHSEQGAGLEFRLNGRMENPQESYNLRVHVDLDGDELISSGDYISMESYPVLPQDIPIRLTVQVRKV